MERAEQIKKNIHEAAVELAQQLELLGLKPGPEAANAATTLKAMGTFYPDFDDVRSNSIKYASHRSHKQCLFINSNTSTW